MGKHTHILLKMLLCVHNVVDIVLYILMHPFIPIYFAASRGWLGSPYSCTLSSLIASLLSLLFKFKCITCSTSLSFCVNVYISCLKRTNYDGFLILFINKTIINLLLGLVCNTTREAEMTGEQTKLCHAMYC